MTGGVKRVDFVINLELSLEELAVLHHLFSYDQSALAASATTSKFPRNRLDTAIKEIRATSGRLLSLCEEKAETLVKEAQL